MSIIAQIEGNVNIYSATMDERTSALMLEESKKWMEHKVSAQLMSDKMLEAKLYTRSARMRDCASQVAYTVCRKCGRKHVTHANLCRDRMCPLCNWRLSMRRYTQMVQIVDGLRKRYPESCWQMCSLTVANCNPSQLNSVMTEMMRAWNYIASRPKTKERIKGWARSIEITYPRANEVHPHIHLLMLWEEGWSPDNYIIDMWINSVRRHATKSAQEQHQVMVKSEYEIKDVEVIPSIYDKPEQDKIDALKSAVLETYKYAIKGSDLSSMPVGVFKQVDSAIKGRRLVAFGGVVKEFAKELDVQIDSPEEPSTSDADELEKCMACGSTQVVQVVGAWTGDGYFWRRTL